MSGPFNVFVVSGYVIDAQWRRPSGRTGALTQYILRAVSRDNRDAAPVDAVFTNTSTTLQGEQLKSDICGIKRMAWKTIVEIRQLWRFVNKIKRKCAQLKLVFFFQVK